MATYYFADNQTGAHASAAVGSNTNNGTSSATPKRTPYGAQGIDFTTLAAGDTVLFAIGGCWINAGKVIDCERNTNATAASPILFSTYDPGGGVTGKPWLKSTSGVAVVAFGGYETGATASHGGYTVEGMHIDGNSVADISGVFAGAPVRFLTIQDCEIDNCHAGIYSYPGFVGYPSTFLLFRRNNVHDNTTFTGWLGCATDCLIEANTFTSNGTYGPDNAGWGRHHNIYYGAGTQPVSRTVIRHNTLTNGTVSGGEAKGGELTFRGLLTYTTVENNLLVNNTGVYLSQAYGISHFSGYSQAESHYYTVIRGNTVVNRGNGVIFANTSYAIIENNALINTTTNAAAAGPWVGIACVAGGNAGGDAADLQQTNATIRNNTIYCANPPASSIGIQGSNANNGGATYTPGPDVRIDNNLVVFGTPLSGSTYAFNVLSETAPATYLSIRNNIWSGVTAPSSAYASTALFESHYAGLGGSCTGNSSQASPGVTTPTSGNSWSLQLTAGSPAIDAALSTNVPDLAIDSYARETTKDIGAFEYGRNP